MTKPKGSTAKSDRTRLAIESAARELFASYGFERTTVREIARVAGIDASMIIRYFGSKDALFALVAMPDLRLPDLGEVDRGKIGETLVRHFIEQWEGSEGGGGLPILLRSASSNDDAAKKLAEIFAAQVLPALARAGDPATAANRAGLVATQILGLALTRYVLKLPPVVAMSIEQLVDDVGATIQRYGTGER
ncbi:MAG: TetR/AcrR family transcriptional regulator [Sphingosinicella sp.]|nr:TetR/AcrR family transcriptional regulator [Sphingosinicella sp.]